jgi:hypothetical protein
MKTITINVSEPVYEDFRRASRTQGRPTAELIREAMESYRRQHLRQHRLGRKRLLDTLLAATYHRAGVRRLATTDWRDFSVCGVFEVERL